MFKDKELREEVVELKKALGWSKKLLFADPLLCVYEEPKLLTILAQVKMITDLASILGYEYKKETTEGWVKKSTKKHK